MRYIALFGGTFNPVHLGHLYVARCIQATFHFRPFYFLPCNVPVHKEEPGLTSTVRLQLLQLALQDIPILHAKISLEEINHPHPIYTVETLTRFRAKQRSLLSITFIVGMDSFITIPTWHRWEELLSLCHILVIERSDLVLDDASPLHLWKQKYQTTNKQDLFIHPYGYIYYFNAGLFPISSTNVRQQLCAHQAVDNLISPSVAKYLKHEWGYRKS